MPRLSIFDTHAEGERWKAALITGTDPVSGESVTQRYIASQLGITEQAVGQAKKSFLTKVAKQAAKQVIRKREAQVINGQAEVMVDEMEALNKNIRRIEGLTDPLYSAISMLLEQAEPEEILHGLDHQARGIIVLLRGLLETSGRLIESLKRVKGELAPEIHMIQMNTFKVQIAQMNQFIFDKHPEILDNYEAWLMQQKERKQ